MKKAQTDVFILITILCAVLFGCNAMAELFHGPKPKETYKVTFDANGASGTPPVARTVAINTVISLPDKGSLTSTGNVFVGWSENAIAISGSDVYIAGNDGGNAVYWLNGTRTTLPKKSDIASADAIAVSGSNIYITGNDGEGMFGRSKAVYWLNGKQKALPRKGEYTGATAIAVTP